MKNEILTIVLVLASTVLLKADNCEPCRETRVPKKFDIALCGGYHGGSITNPYALLFTIYYDEVTCGSVTWIDVKSNLLTSPLWNYRDLGYPVNTLLPCADMCPADANGWPLDLTLANQAAWDAWYMQMITKYLPFSTSAPRQIIRFSSACKALYRVTWPAGSYITVSGGDGAPNQVIPLTESMYLVPCKTPKCCEIEVIEDADGRRTVKVLNENPELCEGQEVDDFFPTMEVTDLDGGNPHTVSGSVTFQGQCRTMCNIQNHQFTTDLTEYNKLLQLEFMPFPTLFHDYIRFNTSVPIEKIEFYDIKGKKIVDRKITTSEINTSDFKEGTYFMRVYFTNKQIRTVKVVKQ